MNQSLKLSVNPAVSTREEDSDGAILYNPDSDALLIVNPIGLTIWKYLQDESRSEIDIVAFLKDQCNEVPLDKVESDVSEFLMGLKAKGFVEDIPD